MAAKARRWNRPDEAHQRSKRHKGRKDGGSPPHHGSAVSASSHCLITAPPGLLCGEPFWRSGALRRAGRGYLFRAAGDEGSPPFERIGFRSQRTRSEGTPASEGKCGDPDASDSARGQRHGAACAGWRIGEESDPVGPTPTVDSKDHDDAQVGTAAMKAQRNCRRWTYLLQPVEPLLEQRHTKYPPRHPEGPAAHGIEPHVGIGVLVSMACLR